jgi:type I restriction enzyme S subunit
MSQKQMGAMPYIKLGMLVDFEINIPSNNEEQNAIAEILTKSDKEIELLQEKLNKLKEQKRYLLNNLITGKIRTPENI